MKMDYNTHNNLLAYENKKEKQLKKGTRIVTG
jgi:hypothetical protein